LKSIVYHKSGSADVLKLEELEKPVPEDDQILIKVCAASVNPLDYHLLRHAFLRRIMSARSKVKIARAGRDLAGQVEAVGRKISQFKPGDEVFGACNGSFAEYACARESALARKPTNVSVEQAAAVPVAALTALQGLRDKGQIQPGQKVLINGASGGVGTFAVQIAKVLGAEVTGVCSTRNVDLVRSIGADHVIDYTHDDFTRSDQRYDLMLDIAGSRPWSECRRVLNPQAILVIVGAPKGNRLIGPLSHIVKVRLAALRSSQKVVFFIAKFNKPDLDALRELLEAGKVTPVVDRRYEFSQIADALRYLGGGHAQGKIVITV